MSELTQLRDAVEDLRAELHDKKCEVHSLHNKYQEAMADQTIECRKMEDELRASEKFREHARLRCIYLEKIIKILLDREE